MAATGPTDGSKVMDVAFVDDHLSVTSWPAWAEAGEALRVTLGDAGGANCAATTVILPLAISASATKLNKIPARSECTRILMHPLCNGAFTRAGKRANVPHAMVQGLRNRARL